MENNKGLGRVSWFGRYFKKIAMVVGLFSPLLGGAIMLLGEADIFRTTVSTDYVPTASEQAIIDNWYDLKFTPWFKNLADEYSTAFEKQGIPQTTKLAVANSIMRKMEIVDEFYHRFETQGLSPGAIDFRLAFVGPMFDKMTEQMTKELGTFHSVKYNGSVSTVNEFSGLISSTSTLVGMKFQYVQFEAGTGTGSSANFLDEEDIGFIDTENTQGTGTENTTTPGAETPTTNSSNTGIIVVAGLATIGAMYMFSNRKKSNN